VTAITCFGKYHNKFTSGHEGDICLAGFSSGKANSLYMLWIIAGQAEVLNKLASTNKQSGNYNYLYYFL
jgi:hypothetical protein